MIWLAGNPGPIVQDHCTDTCSHDHEPRAVMLTAKATSAVTCRTTAILRPHIPVGPSAVNAPQVHSANMAEDQARRARSPEAPYMPTDNILDSPAASVDNSTLDLSASRADSSPSPQARVNLSSPAPAPDVSHDVVRAVFESGLTHHAFFFSPGR